MRTPPCFPCSLCLVDARVEEIDLYEVLEVTRSATRDEIRKSYHKLALRHHPDKAAPDDREAADVRFKAISRAYEILFDDETRARYDTHGMAAFDGRGAGGAGGAHDGVDMDDLLAQMFGVHMGGGGGAQRNGGPGGGPRRMRKGPDDNKECLATLEELYRGKTKKFAVQKTVLCRGCGGRGGKEGAKARECTSCKGRGQKAAIRQAGAFLTQTLVECDACSGMGQVYAAKERCKRCRGAGTSTERKGLEVYLAPGSNHGDRVVLAGEADQRPGQDAAGDIVFTVAEQPHAVFERSGADLRAALKVTLAEALCGFARVVLTTLDGRGLKMEHAKPRHGVLRPGQAVRVPGEGMPIKRSEARGDLYLAVEIEFPADDALQDERVTDQLRALLPPPRAPPKADAVDEVDFHANADMSEFGSTQKGQDHSGWEDEDDDENRPHEARCQQQ